ncbi:hypothetical protein OPT61_g10333 [Boeremia exigua]|uniref:Uncharacterized protein n=1 Tax=Boeremia exigua TaxID=749465 RepID=A0ACC2HQ53_9PLEO|nr:hypothetical protein OPT61_g10333 [Boeremia exigua]
MPAQIARPPRRERRARRQRRQAQDGAPGGPVPDRGPGRRLRAGHPAQRRQRQAVAGLPQLQAQPRQRARAGLRPRARRHHAAALLQAVEAVPRAAHPPSRPEEPGPLRPALPQGQFAVRARPGAAEQDAAHLGDVPGLPDAAAARHHHPPHLRPRPARPAADPAPPHLGPIHPEDAEDFIELLKDMRKYTEAVAKYMEILDNPRFKSKEAKGPFQFWTEMIDLLIDHAKEIDTSDDSGIDVERIIQSGIAKFPDQRGVLWVGLARYWMHKGEYEKARDVFEEAITTVMTVRDFSMVFDTYVEAEETMIGIKMNDAAARSEKAKVDAAADADLDIRLVRFESLMQRRPFLLNDVLLRQNPHNVIEWEKRIALWGDNKKEVVQTYTDAIAAINPKKAVGKFHELWTNYAKFYEAGGSLHNARAIMEKAVKVPFKSVAELAEMWCEWAEMELRNENFDKAVEIMAKATQAPKRSNVDYFDESLTPQQRVHKSWKLWSFYVDLVESVSTLDETKKVYERIFELRIATPQTVVNYANLLEENKYFEDSFKVYERGLDLFSYPVAFEIWNLYLTKAVDRKIGMERLRDLFEQAVEGCPPKFAKVLYLMYGALEEDRGLARHAMRIYERATRAVADEDRMEMFNFYITKSASNFGLTSTRPIYERAIAALPDAEAKEMCLKFAEMERRLGEIDRARAIYGHASQFCDPRTSPEFWKKWESFEVQHGNEDTYKEMLRIKRSVQAQYNTDVNFIASQAIARSTAPDGQASLDDPAAGEDAMAALERQARAPAGFVAASTGLKGNIAASEETTANPDAIDIDDDL